MLFLVNAFLKGSIKRELWQVLLKTVRRWSEGTLPIRWRPRIFLRIICTRTRTEQTHADATPGYIYVRRRNLWPSCTSRRILCLPNGSCNGATSTRLRDRGKSDPTKFAYRRKPDPEFNGMKFARIASFA